MYFGKYESCFLSESSLNWRGVGVERYNIGNAEATEMNKDEGKCKKI